MLIWLCLSLFFPDNCSFEGPADVEIADTKLHGIKALRECGDAVIRNCDIISPEFGWSVRGIRMEDTRVVSEYFMMRSENLAFRNADFKGKYSFQYIKNAAFENCVFDTKDVFWHGENITVRNSVVKGEYLAWYSDGLTLINCKIIGTLPFCCCKNLKLIDCEMMQTDLAFEKSQVVIDGQTEPLLVESPLQDLLLPFCIKGIRLLCFTAPIHGVIQDLNALMIWPAGRKLWAAKM